MFKTLIVFLLFPLSAFAADFKTGLSADLGLVSLDDPEGNVTANYASAAITGNYPLKWRDTSIVSGLGYLRGSADAGEGEVGQDFSGYYVFSRYQQRLALTRAFPSLYGFAGAKFTSVTHKKRHTVYQGYLKDEFKNRDTNTVTANFGAGYRFTHGKGRTSTPSFYIDIPVSGDLAFVGVQYHFEF